MSELSFKSGGVYVIAGGAGGLGRTLTAYLASHYEARVAWLGRRAHNESIGVSMSEIVQQGGEVDYWQTDITCGDAVAESFRSIRERWGQINGVVHSAIVLRDRSLDRMSEEDFLAVLDSKTEGMVCLAESAREARAGWLLVFSSIVAFYNSAGQGNYTAGSAFTDSYALAMESRHGLPVRVINWGYWGDTGVVANERYRHEMAERGMGSIDAVEGMAAVERVLAGACRQVALVKARSDLLKEIGIDAAKTLVAPTASTPAGIMELRAELAVADDPQLTVNVEAARRQLAGLAQVDVLGLAWLRDRLSVLRSTGSAGFTELAVAPNQTRLATTLGAMAARAEAIEIDATRLRSSLTEDYPEMTGYLELLDVCTAALREVLSGRRRGTDVMFPGGSLKLVEKIYTGTIISDYFNRLMAAAVERMVARRLQEVPPGTLIRVLEIGAGTGSTTRFVAEALRPHAARVEYIFSDVSAGFRRHFDRELAEDYRFMRFAVVDLDRDPVEQTVELGSMDIILAANALHVAPDLHRGLQLIKALLRPSGFLVLIEVSTVTVFNSLTYGLLEGWWQAEDAARRLPNAPLLDPAGWLRVLGEEGFLGAGRAEEDRGEATDFFQTLLLAESDGIWVKSAPRETAVEPIPEPPRLETTSVKAAAKSDAAAVRTIVYAELSRVFRLETSDLSAETSFDRLGVDSIVAVEVVEVLNRALQIELRSLDLFNYPTVELLLERIMEAHQPVVVTPSRREVLSGRFASVDPSPSESKSAAASSDSGPVSSAGNYPPGTVAVVGYSMRLPEANDAAVFWNNLVTGVDAVSEVPEERWPKEEYFSADRKRTDRSYSRHAGLLEQIDLFDPLFFGISPHEAEMMDPQQRLFLMESWRAFEDAGYSQEELAGLNCGVFAGCSYGDYEIVLRAAKRDSEAFAFTGTAPAMLPARIAYWLNLKGPTLAVDTACSSSAVAIHLACESLNNGASDVALAGGVSTLSTPRFHVLSSQTGMLSSTGKCHTFGAGADGFVPSEGVAVLVIKRLADAQRDGDRIHGIILGSALNQDGRTTGITAPNGPSQTALEVGLYQKLGLSPDSLGLVECHGTGTRLGDPIEVDALTEAFHRFTTRRQFCALGSVKSNIGHTLMTAGAAAVIKVLLALKHGLIPPTLHCEHANPEIDFAGSPFFLNQQARAWPAGAGPRRAAVSAFGFSGTNVHLVLEEAPPVTVSQPLEGVVPILLSAKSEEALALLRQFLLEWLSSEAGLAASIDAIATTLATGRSHYGVRWGITVSSKNELREALKTRAAEEPSSAVMEEQILPTRLGPWTVAQAQALTAAFLSQEHLSWSELFPRRPEGLVSLPGHPFILERCWVDSPEAKQVGSPSSLTDRVCFAPTWRSVSPPSAAVVKGPARWDLWGDFDDRMMAELQARQPGVLVSVCAESELPRLANPPAGVVLGFGAMVTSLETELARSIDKLHTLTREILNQSSTGRVRLMVIMPIDAGPAWTALGAYLGALTEEAPRVRTRLVRASGDDPRIVSELLSDDDYREVRLGPGTREVRCLASTEDGSGSETRFRENGVCLITGGAGGLGLIFSRHLARTQRSRLVWMGRSPCGEHIEARMRELEALGAEVHYVRGDVTRLADVERAMAETRDRFGSIHAVIHAAGVLRNRFLMQKETSELHEVIGPKVLGVRHLEFALAADQLDVVLLCSSVAAVLPEAGQADYAYANRYLDEWAERSALPAVSINWQMWCEGGMSAGSGSTDADAARQHAEQTERLTGLPPLITTEGLALLDWASSSQKTSGLWGWGNANVLALRAEKMGGLVPLPAPTVPEIANDADKHESTRIRETVRVLLASVLKLSPDRLHDTTPFTDYGVDSILVLKFNERLAELLPEVSKTLLFEFPNLQQLSEHLGKAYGEGWIQDSTRRSPVPRMEAPAPAVASDQSTPTAKPLDETLRAEPTEDIAIIGVAGRFPQADDLETFWDNLVHGRDGITAVPLSRWNAELLSGADSSDAAQGKAYCKWGGFLDGVDQFDASFFNIPPVEAELMDPQQRLLLEVAWQALESAGYAQSDLARWRLGGEHADVGVFAGVTHNTYQLEGVLRNEATPTRVDHSGEWSTANRVSYFFNFAGPSLPVDTACSAALTAVYLACESLRRGECRTALAGAVNLHLHPSKYINACGLGMLSPTGRCRTFGAGADGYVPGEGAGVLVLKPLRAAQRDGDPIHAVIKATAVNHGGRTNGFSVPNPAAQAAVVRAALERADIDPRSISCVEAHGTGTELGDPIEVDGLRRVFATEKMTGPWCSLGSVKSNIGHLEAAAGIAGMVKVLLQFRHGVIAPSLHAAPSNPHIDFAGGPFVVPTEATPWVRPVVDGLEQPRRAGVSSFGAGGSNAHVILEEYQGASALRPREGEEIIVLSARTPPALKVGAERLVAHLRSTGADLDFAALAHTLQAGREAMTERLALPARSVSEVIARLERWLKGDETAVGRGKVTPASAREPIALGADPQSVATGWVGGGVVDWRARRGGLLPGVVLLPGYPFERKRFWYGSFSESKIEKIETLKNPSPAPVVTVNHWSETAPPFGERPEVTWACDESGIALVRMQDQDHRNMFTGAVLEGLMHVFSEIDHDETVQAVVVTGIGNVFSMGGTRDELLSLSDQVRSFASLEFIFKGFLQCRVPVISAMQGHAQGGGLVFGLYADVVVMAEEALYSAVFTKYGFTPGLGATYILADKLGDATATEMMMTASTYRGSDLSQRGAGVTFRPAAEVLSTAMALAHDMAQKPVHTMRTLKQGLAARKLARLPTIIADEVRMHGETFGKAEVKERIRQFIREAGEPTTDKLGPRSLSESKSIPIKLSTLTGSETGTQASPSSPSADEARRWMREDLCAKLHLDPVGFDGQTAFRDLGLDSILSVEFIHGLNRAFRLRLDASIVYDFVNCDDLAEHVIGLINASTPRLQPSKPSQIELSESPEVGVVVSEPPQAPNSDAVTRGRVSLSVPAAVSGHAMITRVPVKLAKLSTAPGPTIKSAGSAEAGETAPTVTRDDPIAIIGMACRLPGARNLAKFWINLAEGVDSVSEVPAERWDVNAFYDPNPQAEGKSYCRTGGFIADIDCFDPLFFNLSHAEAEIMDPQQRLFMEEAWRAIEHAGYTSEELANTNCGVFVGAGTGDYGGTLRRLNPGQAQTAFAGMGLTPSILAARLSYFLNLKGPSVAIDTACSSSLVALHQACRAIQAGDCEMALVGGVSLIIEPDQLITTSKLEMLSPGGRCRPFDQAADGIALSEGVAVVMVKSLAAARAGGDRIYGVVRGSGINQDGKTNGITAPSAKSQAELERTVYLRAGIDPAKIDLVEAHGTGTLLGDPVEVRGLTEAFRSFTSRCGYCALGSVKSNIGHTSFAAGIAGVIKVLLAMENERMPQSLHFSMPNEHIDFTSSPFFVNTSLRAWERRPDRERLAAVSSFGYSGTNAHVVLGDEWPSAPRPTRRSPLPNHVFARDRCWVRPAAGGPLPSVLMGTESMRWVQRNESTVAGPVFVTDIIAADSLIEDHCVNGEHWLAGSLILERALRAAWAALADESVSLINWTWRQPLPVTGALALRVKLQAEKDGTWSVTVGDGSASGQVELRESDLGSPDRIDPEACEARCSERVTGEDFYAGLETGGLVYGPLYRRVRNVAWGDGVGWATLERPTGVPLDASIALMIEGGLQATGVLLQPATNGPTIPVGVGRLRVASSTEWTADLGPVYAAVSRRETTKRRTTFDVTLVDGTGQFLARIEAFSVQTIGTEESESPKLTYLRSRWQASSLSESPSAPTLRKNLLVLDNSGTWTVPLAEQVSGLHVICITAGDTFELRADGATVRPGEVGDLTQVLATFPPAAVMHRWAHDPAADAEGIRLGFETILLASQCLLRCGMDRPLPALVVLPRDAPPAWVALPALTKTIRLEQPSLRWKIVSGEVTVERAVAEIKRTAVRKKLNTGRAPVAGGCSRHSSLRLSTFDRFGLV